MALSIVFASCNVRSVTAGPMSRDPVGDDMNGPGLNCSGLFVFRAPTSFTTKFLSLHSIKIGN